MAKVMIKSLQFSLRAMNHLLRSTVTTASIMVTIVIHDTRLMMGPLCVEEMCGTRETNIVNSARDGAIFGRRKGSDVFSKHIYVVEVAERVNMTSSTATRMSSCSVPAARIRDGHEQEVECTFGARQRSRSCCSLCAPNCSGPSLQAVGPLAPGIERSARHLIGGMYGELGRRIDSLTRSEVTVEALDGGLN
jgi:hypothetical protein